LQKKIFIKTLGCQMNEYDSNRILDLTKKINYFATNNISEASCYVLNTCHIREKATDKVYHDIGRLKKEFKNKKKPIVLIAGCVAQAEGDILLKKEKYIDAVIGPQAYHQINNTILDLENKKEKINITEFNVIDKFDKLNLLKNSNSKVSSYLTIQEGCDKFCKFCVVPYTRGGEYSRSIDEIVNEANNLVKNGAKEITLLGQNVNAYYYEDKKLSHLIYEIAKIKKLLRIRYTTSHPKDFSDDLIEAHGKCKKLMPLIHLPVQSGSNKILASMNRKHLIEDYLEVVNKLKKTKPSIKFSSDFIIGYPGETQEDFRKTLQLIKNIEFINTYSFIFNARPGTPASNLDEINSSISKTRLKEFQIISSEIKKRYRKKLIGNSALVLFENKTKNGNDYFGRDEFYNSVIVSSNENLTGKLKKINIKEINNNTMFGTIDTKIQKKDFAA
jgi:tRNA-2-methylthio-N6-dimethylallyladenosine synthase